MQYPAEPNIIVAPADPKDVRGMQEVFYRTWLATYPNEQMGISVDDIDHFFKDAFGEAELKKHAERLANPPNGQFIFFAKEKDRVIGVCRIRKFLNNNQLQAIYVLPEYQSKGIGFALWKRAEAFLDSSKETFVKVATYNQNAIKFYEKLGFRDTGKRFNNEQFKTKNGIFIPEMEMFMSPSNKKEGA